MRFLNWIRSLIQINIPLNLNDNVSNASAFICLRACVNLKTIPAGITVQSINFSLKNKTKYQNVKFVVPPRQAALQSRHIRICKQDGLFKLPTESHDDSTMGL